MAEQLKINIPEEVCLTTIRTVNSRLWFTNNKKVEQEILGYLAKYQNMYGIILYAFILMGNHYHMVAKFPRGNRHQFKKAFNRIFANILRRHEPQYLGGQVWQRRYRPQALPRNADIKHWFFYSVLNPISSGLVNSIYDYPMFNSFFLSLSGKSRVFNLINWTKFRNLRRYNKCLTVKDCTEHYKLTFSPLPGYEDMSQEDYREFLLDEYKKRKDDLIVQRRKEDKGFLGENKLRQVPPGSYPTKTKRSGRYSRRPLVLTLCSETRIIYLAAYFSIWKSYKLASRAYRNGKIKVNFPPGTFKPSLLFGCATTLA